MKSVLLVGHMINFKPISFVVGLSLSNWRCLCNTVLVATGGTATTEFLASAVLAHAIALVFTRMGYCHKSFRLECQRYVCADNAGLGDRMYVCFCCPSCF